MTDEREGTPPTDMTEPYFAPEHTAPEETPARPRFPLRRLFVRIAACLLALVALDLAIAPFFAPPAAYMHDYRLPRVSPTAELADYANAIDLAARVPGHAPIAVWLGASPTFGYRVGEAGNTFPYAYERAAAERGIPLKSFNVAALGMFVGDYYVLTQRLLDDSDIIFVQLTYHTFSPPWRMGQRIGFPELPNLLGVPLSDSDSEMLGLKASDDAVSTPAPPAALGEMLSRWWTLWRERDLIDKRLVGGVPRDALANYVRKRTARPTSPLTSSSMPPQGRGDDGFAIFGALTPAQQKVIVDRYVSVSHFTIDTSDSEIVLLDRLAATVKASGKKAVFYMGPLNREMVTRFHLIDLDEYDRNVATLRSIVERHGFMLIDHSTDGSALSFNEFVDISHTTDAGGIAFAQSLLQDTFTYVQSETP